MKAHVHRVVSIAFTGLIALSAMPALRAQVPEQSVTYYGLTFPMEIGGARRISVRDYETTNPGLGYSAGYQHRGATSTLYIYDGKVAAIPDDPRAPMVTEQIEQARSNISEAQPARTTVEDKGTFTIADSGNRPRLVCDRFVIKKP